MLTLSSPVLPRLALIFVAFLNSAESVDAQFWRRTPKVEATPGVNQENLNAFLRPLRTARATLSRDGRQLAYTITEGGRTTIEVVGTDYPYNNRRIELGDLADARLTALEWVSADRLVFSTEQWVIGMIDLEQGQARAVLNANRFPTEIIPFDINASTIGTDGQDTLGDMSYEIPRSPRLVRLANHSRNTVIIEGVAGGHLRDSKWVTAELNLDTGDVRMLESFRGSSTAMRTLIDRTGRFRLIEDRENDPCGGG